MISTKILNGSLKGLLNRINFDQIDGAAAKAQNELSATTTTKLGAVAGNTSGGFQSLTEEIDDVVDTAGEVVGGGMSLLIGNPDGVKVIEDISSSNISDLTDIAGLTISSGLNKSIVSASTPQAVGASVSNIANKPLSAISSSISAVAPLRFSSISVDSVIKNLVGTGIGLSFTSVTSLVTASRDNYLNTGIGEAIKDLIEVVDKAINTEIINLTQDSGKIVPIEVKRSVSNAVDQGQYKAAAELLVPYSDRNVVDMETSLSKLSTSVSKGVETTNTAYSGLGTTTSPVNVIGEKDTQWQGTNTRSDYQFSFVSSLEELEAELRSAVREITEVVLHWTANYIDQATVGSEEIHNVHTQRGFSGIGYHYIITRDGRIQRGRPINLRGAHARDFGHNNYSIGISHVAGYNCVSGTANPERYVSADSISAAQWSAQKDFLTAFYRVFPGGQVLGHYQCTTTSKIDPGFDVDAYIKNTFDKENALKYENNFNSLSTAELIAQRISNG